MPEKNAVNARHQKYLSMTISLIIFARRCAYAQVWGFFMSSTTKEKKRHKLKCIVDVEGFARLIHTYSSSPRLP
jgi:hypothetical protein